MSKKIGIDARMIDESGIGRYIRNLLGQLEKIDQDNEYVIFLRKADYDRLVYHSKRFQKVIADFGWYGLSEQLRLPILLDHYRLDLVHFPHFNVPIFYQGKFVVTIHDLIHQHYQMSRATSLDPLTYRVKRFGYNQVFSNAVKRAQKILVPSNFVKDQLVNGWSVDESKIVVTPEAVEEQLVAIAAGYTQGEIDRVLNKLNLKPPYIFYVGNAHPHKNVEGLITAFGQLKSKVNGLKLVLAGSEHYFWRRIKEQHQHPDIVYPGYVTDEELVALYKGAKCLVMPSFEEGFGIPLLEAFACSCPVASSKAGSLPEVGGDACLYFDPTKPKEMENKIWEMLSNQTLQKKLIKKGLERYKQFSWQKLAQQTLSIYQSV